jgi:EAL domain-containing protein (putative c-di-GMP-specific phosphodiesterase class I)
VLVLGTDHCDVVNGASELRELLSTAIDLAAVSEHLLMPLLHGQDRGDATANEVRSVIDARAFHPVYQPIVDLQTRRVVGYEALTRFADGVPPDRRFADATRAGLGLDLELVTLAEALRVSAALPPGRYLSVNVSPTLLATPELASLLREDHDRPVVVELTEHERVDDYEAITAALDRLGGVRLSVDDAGSGWASLRHVLTLRPHYVKLDRAWVAAVDRDPARQALLLGIGQFVERLGGAVVAEGIEHASECEVLGQLGIRFGQGYHLGRPVPVAEVLSG